MLVVVRPICVSVSFSVGMMCVTATDAARDENRAWVCQNIFFVINTRPHPNDRINNILLIHLIRSIDKSTNLAFEVLAGPVLRCLVQSSLESLGRASSPSLFDLMDRYQITTPHDHSDHQRTRTPCPCHRHSKSKRPPMGGCAENPAWYAKEAAWGRLGTKTGNIQVMKGR
jgi:hypothetical protein